VVVSCLQVSGKHLILAHLSQNWAKKLKSCGFTGLFSSYWMNQITSFKMLTYTVFNVLFSYVHGFGQKNYLSPIGFGNKHN